MRSRITSVLVVALLLASGHALAQSRGATTGDITGVVSDDSGAAVGGASVTARNPATGFERQAISNVSGGYLLPLLPPGKYDVTCELTGFSTILRRSVTASIGSVSAVDFKLTVAQLAETIEVLAGASMIEPGKTQNATVVGPERIQNLPINQRDFLAFALTTPGVNSDRAPQLGAAANSGLSFSGQSARYNNIMIDGLDNNDNAVGSVRSTFSQEAIQEFQVLSSNFSAEYGRALGGVVNIVTKSGTNEWRGSAFFFDRDDALDADNAFAPPGVDLPFSQMQYGATLGGPLKKDKTFIFAALERLDVEDNNIVTISPEAASAIRAAGFPLETGVLPFVRWSNTAFLRLDQRFGAENNLTVRYNFASARNENQEAWGGLNAKSRGGGLELNDQAASIALSSVLSTSLIHEARFQYSRRDYDLGTFDPLGGPNVRILGVAEIGSELNLPHQRLENQYYFVDSLTVHQAAHTLKAGFDANHIRYETKLPNVKGGLHVFAAIPPLGLATSLDAFRRGVSAAYVQSFGDDTDAFTNTLLSAYVQDDWRVSARFTVKLGVRYDNERLPEPYPSDDNNLAPRVAVAYTSHDNKTNLRGGYGRFYGATSAAPILGPRLFGTGQLKILQLSLPQSAAAYAQPGHRFASNPGIGVPSDFRISPDFQTNYADQGSIGLDRALSDNVSVSVGGQYVRGRHILLARDINRIDPSTRKRPDPNFVGITVQESTGNSWYQGLTVAVNKRMSRGTEFLLSYTLSKAEDDFIDWFGRFGPQDVQRPDLDKGPSFQDERHRLTFSGVWDLSGYTDNAVLDNWLLGTIVSYGSGRPFNALAGFDRNGDGESSFDRPAGFGRNSETGPDYFAVDLRASRKFPFSAGKRNLELLFEVFNLFDRTNYSAVNNVFGPGSQPLPAFGQPVSAFPARQIQLGARITF